jgi:hypothetical protein
VKIPDFSMPDLSSLLGRIATSVEKLSDAEPGKDANFRKADDSHPRE